MKIIDATWEKKNLGITTQEIIIEKNDSVSDLFNSINNLNNLEYITVKVPSGGVEYIKCLSDLGFTFAETLFEVSLEIRKYKIPYQIALFDKNITYRYVPPEMLDYIGNEINKGIFRTDRIALDTRFGIEVSANRYYNWIKDETVKGSCIYEIILKEKPIGFFALKQTGKSIFEIFLAGMYVSNSNFFLGFSIISKPIEEIKKRNGKCLTTHVSSNNLPVIRLYNQFGFITNNIFYVMTKHI